MPIKLNKYRVTVITTEVTERDCVVWAGNAEAAGDKALSNPVRCNDLVWSERSPVDGDSYVHKTVRA